MINYYIDNEIKLENVAIKNRLSKWDGPFDGFRFITHPTKDSYLFIHECIDVPWLRISMGGEKMIFREIQGDDIEKFEGFINDWKKNPVEGYEYIL